MVVHRGKDLRKRQNMQHMALGMDVDKDKDKKLKKNMAVVVEVVVAAINSQEILES